MKHAGEPRNPAAAAPPRRDRTGEALMLSRRYLAFAAAGAPVLLAAEAKAQNAPAAPGQSTIDRVKDTKTLRIAALPGEAPYFNKDLATGEWSGMCVEMAKHIAVVLDGH